MSRGGVQRIQEATVKFKWSLFPLNWKELKVFASDLNFFSWEWAKESFSSRPCLSSENFWFSFESSKREKRCKVSEPDRFSSTGSLGVVSSGLAVACLSSRDILPVFNIIFRNRKRRCHRVAIITCAKPYIPNCAHRTVKNYFT